MRKTQEVNRERTGLMLGLCLVDSITGQPEIVEQEVNRNSLRQYNVICFGEEPSKTNLFERYRVGFD